MAEKTVYIIDIDDKARAKLKGIQNEAKNTDNSMGGFASTLKGLAGGAVVAALVGIGKGIYDITAAAEQTRISMEVMLGDAGKANKMIGEIRAFAAATPFETQDLEQAAQMMLGYGIAAEKIMPNIKMLGDISGGNADKFQRLTYAFSQIQATGKLMGQDLMQLVNAGFNPLKTISDKTGISMGILKKNMSDGAISAEMVSAAFKIETEEGGRFFGMMDKQSQTLSGKFSTIIDNVKLLGLSMGTASMGGMHSFLDATMKLVTYIGEIDWTPLTLGLGGVGAMFTEWSLIMDKLLGMFGGTGIVTMQNFLKTFSTAILLMIAPLRLLYNVADILYETIASLINLDWNRLDNIGKRQDIFKKIGGEISDVWSYDEKPKTGRGGAAESGNFYTTMSGKNNESKPYVFGSDNKEKTSADIFNPLFSATGKTKKQSAGGISLSESRNGATNINITIDTFQKNDFTKTSEKYQETDVSGFLEKMRLGLLTVLNDSQVVGVR